MPPNVRSLVLTADGVVSAVPCRFYGFILATAAGVCSFFDNASAASGTEVARGSALGMYMFPGPIDCRNGLFLDLTGAEVTVFFN